MPTVSVHEVIYNSESLVVNLCMHLSWIRIHWEPEFIADAEEKIRQTVSQLTTSLCT